MGLGPSSSLAAAAAAAPAHWPSHARGVGACQRLGGCHLRRGPPPSAAPGGFGSSLFRRLNPAMVLESVVADLLNRFLGDYVENLNKSQLKLGIWGGKREGAAGARSGAHASGSSPRLYPGPCSLRSPRLRLPEGRSTVPPLAAAGAGRREGCTGIRRP